MAPVEQHHVLAIDFRFGPCNDKRTKNVLRWINCELEDFFEMRSVID